MITQILTKIGFTFISLAVAVLYGLLLGGFVRRIVARVHGRIGIPFWQPILNILKNNTKRTAVSHGIMFYLGPVFRIAGGLGTYLFIPVIFGHGICAEIFSNFSMSGDVLLVMYFIFFGQLGMALGAGESGHPNSPFAIARGLSQMTAFEVPFALSVVALAIQYKTLNITDIVAAQQAGIFSWTLFTNPFASIAAIIALLGMNMHSPFNIVVAPQELPVGPPTEYHGQFLGLMATNRGLFTAAKLVLFMNLYLGGATNLPIMVLKTFALYMVSVVVGVAFPRFRTEQSIRFFLTYPTIMAFISLALLTIF